MFKFVCFFWLFVIFWGKESSWSAVFVVSNQKIQYGFHRRFHRKPVIIICSIVILSYAVLLHKSIHSHTRKNVWISKLAAIYWSLLFLIHTRQIVYSVNDWVTKEKKQHQHIHHLMKCFQKIWDSSLFRSEKLQFIVECECHHRWQWWQRWRRLSNHIMRDTHTHSHVTMCVRSFVLFSVYFNSYSCRCLRSLKPSDTHSNLELWFYGQAQWHEYGNKKHIHETTHNI